MPTLLDLQRAMRTALADGDDTAAVAMLADGVPADRLDIHRNTFVAGASRALRLSFPAVHRLVGDDFFTGAAAAFIARHPPPAACLDDYGAGFPRFLRDFPRALDYLFDVASLEWAVSCAVHAPDTAPLDLMRLVALPPEDQARVSFVAHPAITLLSLDYPADDIWRGVLGGDDAALGAIDLTSGPVRVLVEHGADGVQVSRLDAAAFEFTAALCAGQPLSDAFAHHRRPPHERETPWEPLIAAHLAAGRFVDFHLAPDEVAAPPAGDIPR